MHEMKEEESNASERSEARSQLYAEINESRESNKDKLKNIDISISSTDVMSDFLDK